MKRLVILGSIFLAAEAASAQVVDLREYCSGGSGIPALVDGDRFGCSIADIGDLDGNGVDDLVVGAVGDDTGGNDRGAVYVLFLDSSGAVQASQKIADGVGGFLGVLDDNDHFGRSVAHLGDLDGAGGSATTIAVGAHFDDDGGVDRGAVWILSLNANGTVSFEQKISSTSGGFTGPLEDRGYFGRGLVNMGDLDGAGPSVIALGVGAANEGLTDYGAVYILFLDASGLPLSHSHLTNSKGGLPPNLIPTGASFGTSLAWRPGGSFAGSLAIGANKETGGGVARGAVYLVRITDAGLARGVRKIGSDTGNFDGPLDDRVAFGNSLAWLHSAVGTGNGTLAVGEGGINNLFKAGAVWILALDSLNNVVGQRKIADGDGEMPPGTLVAGDRFGRALHRPGPLPSVAGAPLLVGAPHENNVTGEKGCFFRLETREVLLAARPEVIVTPGALELRAYGGSPSKLALMYVMAFNGSFFPYRLITQPFDAQGQLVLTSASTPTSLAGNNVTFQTFALSATSKVVESNQTTVVFQ